MLDKAKGISLFGLVGLVVSSCIGAGIFNLPGDLSRASSPGGALVGWLIAGIGFLCLALSLVNLGKKRPDIDGLFAYAEEGFGPMAGFISGWGYWFSAWLGSVGFAVMVIQAFCGINPEVFGAPTAPSIPVVILVSAILWALTYLVIRGVESASLLNAIVMTVKVISIVIFIAFAVLSFNFGVFTADFWGNVANNAAAATADAEGYGNIGIQALNCMLVMMWVFIGIEGANVMSKRAEKQSDVGKATIIGLVALLVMYVLFSILPYGVLPVDQLAKLDNPAAASLFEIIAPGWGGAFLNVAVIISVLGSWLSFTILPAETSSLMAEHALLPKSWARMNKHNAPQLSLVVIGVCVQIVLIIALISADAYTFAISMCTVAIVITWSLAVAYQIKYSYEQKEIGQLVIGITALLFQIAGSLFTGWGFFLLVCIGYIPGFLLYARARKEAGWEKALSRGEWICTAVFAVAAIASVPLTAVGIIPVF